MSRKRSIRGKSHYGAIILRQPCRYYLKGTCTRTPCEYWHPPECQLCKSETGCEAGDKCLFLHHEVDEQPNKKPKKGCYSQKRRENDDNNAKIVPKLRCVSQDSEAWVSQSGKQSQRNPMQKVLEPIGRIRLTISTLRQASIREKKGPSLGKIQVKNPHQESLHAIKFEDRSLEETKRQQRCARSKAWNLAKNTYKLKENDKATFCSPAEEKVLPAASAKVPEERESS